MSYPPAATLPSPRAVAAAATAAYFLFGPCSILPFHPFFSVLVFCLSRLDFATAYSIDSFVLLLLVVRALRLKFEIERVRDRGSDCGCLWFLALSPFLSEIPKHPWDSPRQFSILLI